MFCLFHISIFDCRFCISALSIYGLTRNDKILESFVEIKKILLVVFLFIGETVHSLILLE